MQITTGGMQDIIEDVKELFLLQSSRPYNMMRERERELLYQHWATYPLFALPGSYLYS